MWFPILDTILKINGISITGLEYGPNIVPNGQLKNPCVSTHDKPGVGWREIKYLFDTLGKFIAN